MSRGKVVVDSDRIRIYGFAFLESLQFGDRFNLGLIGLDLFQLLRCLGLRFEYGFL